MAKKSKSTNPNSLGIRPNELIIHDGNYGQFCHDDYSVNGQKVRRGLNPRDFKSHPVGCYKNIPSGVNLVPFPQTEWSERCRDQIAQERRCSDFRRKGNKGQLIPSRDQNGKGYCWAHSGVSAHIITRAVMNEPYVSLSAYAIACIIKNYRDEGGWGAQGVDFQIERGCPSDEYWKQQSMSKANDKPETWTNAALHKITKGWIDMQSGQYDRNLTFAQYATLWLSSEATVNDYNWWSHSVGGADLVDGSASRKITRDPTSGKLLSFKEFNKVWAMDDPVTGGFGCRIWNSWGDGWSDQGEGILTGSKAVPDGGVGLRTVTPSVA